MKDCTVFIFACALAAMVGVVAGGDLPSVRLHNLVDSEHLGNELEVAAVSSMERTEALAPFVAREPVVTLDPISPVLPPSGHAVPVEQILLAMSEPATSGNAAGSAAPGLTANAAPSAWSDITAVFRPSRWADPFRPGGPLSFLNLECWFTVPGRTCLTLLGTATVGAAIAAATDNGGDKNNTDTTDTTPSGSGSNKPKPRPDDSDSSSDGSSNDSGGSGGGGGGGDTGGGGFTEEEG